MKKHIILYLGLCSIFILCGCTNSTEDLDMQSQIKSTRALTYSDYYWYNGEKIGIEKDQSKSYILFKPSFTQTLTSNATIVDNPQRTSLSPNIKDATVNKTLNWAIVENSAITSSLCSSSDDVIYQAPCFNVNSKEEVGLGFLFYVKLKSANDLSTLQKQASDNNVKIVGQNKYMPLWYTLACTKESSGNALQVANKFYETGNFAASEPDFLPLQNMTCDTNDPLFGHQWNLKNTGQNGGTIGDDINYLPAHNKTSGDNNIIVAVIDQGIQMDHPDLNIYSKSYDSETGTSPSVIYGDHATACSGIIAAKTDNNIGISGIAPNCPLMSISNPLVTENDLNQKLADAFNYAWENGASVISNSWYSPSKQEILDDAITNALTKGRNGLGCVVAFAAGNFNGDVCYPANSNPDILVVGAMSPTGQRKSPTSSDGETWWGSNYGKELDVVAPGVKITTTDRTGSDGYDASDYVYNFNGTSSACPHVAGVAALILSMYPNLTELQVSDIIERTATKLPEYSYSATSGRNNGLWNNETGYGLVNAYAAIAGIQNIINQTYSSDTSIYGSDITTTNINVINNSKLTLKATNSITINYPFYVEQGSQVEISY